VNTETLITELLQAKCTDEERIAFIPLLVKSAGLKLDPATQAALFTKVGELIGAKPSDTDEVLTRKLEEYYQKNPPSRALQKVFTQYFERASGRATADGFETVAKKAKAEETHRFNAPKEKKR